MGLNGGGVRNPNNVELDKVFRFFTENVDEVFGLFGSNGDEVFGFFAANGDEVFGILVEKSKMRGLVSL